MSLVLQRDAQLHRASRCLAVTFTMLLLTLMIASPVSALYSILLFLLLTLAIPMLVLVRLSQLRAQRYSHPGSPLDRARDEDWMSMQMYDRELTAEDYETLLALDEGSRISSGLPQTLIDRLPVYLAPPTMQGQCAICLENMHPGEELRPVPCMHSFHRACIDEWLAAKNQCPVCQHQLDLDFD